MTLNARSLRNKVGSVITLLDDFDVDVGFIQETWLRTSDGAILREINENGYKVLSYRKQRKIDRGGGVAAICKSYLKVSKALRRKNYKSFENLECLVHAEGKMLRFINIYRPDYSEKHRYTASAFIEELSDYIQDILTMPGTPIFLGDYNIHVEIAHTVSSNTDTLNVQRFMNLLEKNDLQQLVKHHTQRLGGTLDLVITHEPELINDLQVHSELSTSDHYPIMFNINCIPSKENFEKLICYRRWKNLDVDSFRKELRVNQKLADPENSFDSLETAINAYISILIDLTDKHCPVIKRKVKRKLRQGWFNDSQFNDSLKLLKKLKRRSNRLYQKHRSPQTKKQYKTAIRNFNDVRNDARPNFYKDKLLLHEKNLRQIYKTVESLTSEDTGNILPSFTNEEELANSFAEFFVNKVSSIRENLSQEDVSGVDSCSSISNENHASSLERFKKLSQCDVVNLIKSMKSKCSSQDPIPVWLLKKCLPELTPILHFIINKSLETSHFPDLLKHAIVKPSVKDRNGDKESLKNYRPISNLTFLSKLLEKAALSQIDEHINNESLHSPFQSGYRPNHSCETAILKFAHDIQMAFDDKHMVAAIFLDMSAAFDTVDHDILFNRLEQEFKIKNAVLKWLVSYLSNRTFSVVINDKQGRKYVLQYGVPQGSLLGPLLFILYVKEISSIAQIHGLKLQTFADDTTLYIEFKPILDRKLTYENINSCLNHIKFWLTTNFLKLNPDKTVTMFFGSKTQTDVYTDLQINFNGEPLLKETNFVKSLGVKLDANLSMVNQVNELCKSCSYSLHRLQRIRNCLDTKLRLLLVKSYILTKIDYCNVLLCNVPDCYLMKLQKVINSCVSFIYNVKKREHITVYLAKAHILPIKFRIIYKLCVTAFKVLNNLAPSYLNDVVERNCMGPYFTRTSCDLLLLKTCSAPQSISYKLTYHWNALPSPIRYLTDLIKFKNMLKTHLFHIAFNY